MIPTITTPRLTLRPLQMDDAEPLYRVYLMDGVLRYFPNPNPPPLERVQKFIENQLMHWAQYSYGHWAIIPQGEMEIIGWAGLQYLPETGETEVGYLLNRLYWGLGYATEAAWSSLLFGFSHFNFEIIIGLVHPENIASQHVLEKCGLAFVDQKAYFGMDMFRYWIDRRRFQQLLEKCRGEVCFQVY